MNVMHLIIILGEAAVMLFQLRSLMQSSSADYYNPAVQLVAKLTDPVVRLMPFRQAHLGGFFYAGFVVSLIFALLFCTAVWLALSGRAGIIYAPLLGILMTVKCLGYLILVLLLIQALTSWLPSTRHISMLCYQITYPITAPVQKLIPPIGMIDISLMIVMIALFALNALMGRLFGVMWLIF
ncbi:MAG: YggT family protein [Succinivibrio sp.]|nr:YggT family protein [Succinivibrio sp.]